MKKHHSNITSTYHCSKCSRVFPSIFGISSHFSKCVQPTTSPSGDLEFRCPNCEASFSSKRGLGVHRRRRHPAEDEADQNTQRTKERWTQEELLFMAECEASVPIHITNCNQLLHPYLPHCTIGSIKGIQKGERYKQLLQAARDNTSQEPSSDEPTTTNDDSLPPDLPNTTTTPSDNSTTSPSSITTSNPTSNLSTHHEDPFQSLLQELSTQVNTELCSIIHRHLNSINISQDLECYIINNFSGRPPTHSRRKNPTSQTDQRSYRHKIKRQQYARFQRLFTTNKKRLANEIFNQLPPSSTFPPTTDIKSAYQELYESPSPHDSGHAQRIKKSDPTYYPITVDEIKQQRKQMPNKAAGPDNFTIQDLKTAPPTDLCAIYNIILSTCTLPTCWKLHCTILIPKKSQDLHLATNWRPITISSTCVCLLHRILACRLTKATQLNPRQKAFIPADGCRENTLLLDHVIRQARKQRCTLSILGIDLAKAFDSITHNCIARALRRNSIDEPMVQYILQSYTNCTTTILCGPTNLPNVKLLRGIKQGDPLSPILFNLILDKLLDILPPSIGISITTNLRLNCLAFANDLILISESPSTMKILINITTTFFSARSMKINATKCFCLRIALSMKNHTIINVTEPTYHINNHPIPRTGYNQFFKYLGVQFNPSGKMKVNVNKVSNYLHYLQSSPLKPQQKLFMLREYLIPKLYHQLILGRITIGLLKQLDLKIRQFIKSFLHLQHFTPDTSVADCGLRIPQLLYRIPGFLLFHLEKLRQSNDIIITSLSATDEIQSLRSKCLSILNLEGIPTKAEQRKQTNKHTHQQLYSTVDGKGLQEAKKFPQANQWIRGATRLMHGNSFIHSIHLRINQLPVVAVLEREFAEVAAITLRLSLTFSRNAHVPMVLGFKDMIQSLT